VRFDDDADLKKTGLVLTSAASPASVTIEGGGRVVKLVGTANNPLITVGSGVTLTLKHITFKGKENTAPLIVVENGGTLILEEGAVIADNSNGSGNGGGVRVDRGGTLIMTGGEISGNSANRGGGVYVAKGGTFRKTGGVISDANVANVGGKVAAAYDGRKFRDETAGTGINLYFGPDYFNDDGYADFDLKDRKEPPSGAGNTDSCWLSPDLSFSNSVTAVGSVIDRIRVAHGRPDVAMELDPLDEEFVRFDADTDLGVSGLELEYPVTSPASVTINGSGRVVSLDGAASGNPLITVGSGVTLRLKHITFKGLSNNGAPLIRVKSGGTLFLEEGAVIAGNSNGSSNGGGVCVDSGGMFTMTGGEISGHSAKNGGGVYVAKGGTFRKSGGVIAGDNTVNQGGVGKMVAVFGGVKYREDAVASDVKLYFGPDVNGATDNYPDFDLNDYASIVAGGVGDTELSWLPHGIPFSGYSSVIDMIRASRKNEEISLTVSMKRDEEKVQFGVDDVDTLGVVLTSENSPHVVNIDGGGRTIVLTGVNPRKAPLITVDSGVTLTLSSIIFEGLDTAHGDSDNNNAPLFKVQNGGSLHMNVGTIITKNKNDNGVGGVLVESDGTVIMSNNTEISDMCGTWGGGVLVSGGQFTMNGGEIRNNKTTITTTVNGGGVHMNSGNFNLNGGKIESNESSNDGGGVFISGGLFAVSTSGGSIKNNTAKRGGGGVYVINSDAFFTMQGGIISDNEAGENGGGVCVHGGGNFDMNYQATIYGNRASVGGGVLVNGNFIMANGKINNNTADNAGGGVYLADGTFTLERGTLSDNIVRDKNGRGGGVYVSTGTTFDMKNGSIISSAIAPEQEPDSANSDYCDPLPCNYSVGAPPTVVGLSFFGCGVYVSDGATFTKTGGTILGLIQTNTGGDSWEYVGGQSFYGYKLITDDNGQNTFVDYGKWSIKGQTEWIWPIKGKGYAVYYARSNNPLWRDRSAYGDTEISTKYQQETGFDNLTP
jgi:hypothetical protein